VTEVHFCKAGEWAKRAIQDEIMALGAEFIMQHDDVSKCGTVVMEDKYADAVTEIVFNTCELRDRREAEVMSEEL
jgi:uncharacterized protein YdaT